MNIKKLISLSILQIIVLSTVYAQTNQTHFSPEWEDFKITLPENPKDYGIDLKDEERSRFYYIRNENDHFYINSEHSKKFSEYDTIANYLSENLIEVYERSFKDFNGEYLSFRDSEEFYQRVLVVQRPNRFYIFHTVSISKESSDVDNFFDSLEFVRNAHTKYKQSKLYDFSNRKISDAKVVGEFNDLKKVYVEPELLEYKIAPKDAKGPTHGLKILSKSKPSYTEIARSYNLTGQVKLRGVFLTNEKLGDISVVKPLPFGLTNNAIKAMREIKFKPPHLRGTPYHVSKVVVYNFKIY